jgi:hypothetical protein
MRFRKGGAVGPHHGTAHSSSVSMTIMDTLGRGWRMPAFYAPAHRGLIGAARRFRPACRDTRPAREPIHYPTACAIRTIS